MKTIIAAFVLILYPLLFCETVFADVSVSLKLDRVEATLTDTVRMEIRVDGSRTSDTVPLISGLESFRVTKGGTSSRVKIINGSVESGIDYAYFIQPKKIGAFAIGPAVIEIDGQKLKSNTVTLEVKNAAQSAGADTGPVFIEASISSNEVYIEEQTIYTLKLYHRINVDDLALSLPEIEHVSFKQLGDPRNYQTVYAGKSYHVLEVRYALLASKAGNVDIGPSKMTMTVRQPGGRSLFDDFFSDSFFKGRFPSISSGRPLHLSTRPIELKVHDLPQKGKPTNFTGLVGDFKIESQLEPDNVRTGESATLTVCVSGKGNATRIPIIDFPDLPFAQVYSDQPAFETEMTDHGIGGTKTMKWALVPEKEGRFDIPELTLSYFNPETHAYHTLRSPHQVLTVLPGKKQDETVFNASLDNNSNDRGSLKKEIEQIGEDILPIHTAAGGLSVPFRIMTSGWRFWLSLAGPVAIYLVLLAGLNLRNRSHHGRARSRSRNAYKKFMKRCRKVGGDSIDLLDAFKEYLNDKFSLSIGTLTSSDAGRLLEKHNVNTGTAGKIRQIIETIESAVYAGNNVKDSNVADDLLKLVKTLEKEIR